MIVDIHPQAERELNEQADYYEQRAVDLGVAFIDAFYIALNLIAELPRIGTFWREGYRRLVRPRFPHSIFYVTDDRQILVMAVAHDRRQPGYWLIRSFDR